MQFNYEAAASHPVHAFSDLAAAGYCSQRLYCGLRDGDHETPAEVRERRAPALRYPGFAALDADLTAEPMATTPTQNRSNLGRARELVAWDGLCDLARTNAILAGREARGIAHKVFDESLSVSVVSAESPRDEGVWRLQTARAVAAAKALPWEAEVDVGLAYVEYPAYGVVRRLNFSTRRKSIYREAVARAESIDGPPVRLSDEARCDPCEYRERCGVKMRALRSLL